MAATTTSTASTLVPPKPTPQAIQTARNIEQSDEALARYKAIVEPMPWDRLKGEKGVAYEMFVYFREQGPGRNLRSVWQDFNKSEYYVRKLSSERRWMERARCWDDHVRRQKEEAVIDAERTMAVRQAKLGMEMQEVAMDRVKDFKGPLRETLDVQDVVRLADTGVKIERLARGATTGDENTLNFVLPAGLPKWAPQTTPVKELTNGEGSADGNKTT